MKISQILKEELNRQYNINRNIDYLIGRNLHESLNRLILNESLTDVVYHFTDYSKIFNIISENRFKMVSSNISSKDANFSKGYKYFMCVTRQKDGRIAYSADKNVRIILNGSKLNYRYKSIPVNYFYDNNGVIDKNYDKKRYYEWYENEDRILSNNRYIDNFLEYVLRIDISPYSDIHTVKYNNTIQSIINDKSPYLNKIRIYTKSKDFETANNNYITIYEYANYLNKNLKKDKKLYALELFNKNMNSPFQIIYLKNDINIVILDGLYNCVNNGKYISEKWFEDLNEILTFVVNTFNEQVITNSEPITDNISKICVSDKWGGNIFKRYNLMDKNYKILSYDWFAEIGNFKDGYANTKIQYFDIDELEDAGEEYIGQIDINGNYKSDNDIY